VDRRMAQTDLVPSEVAGMPLITTFLVQTGIVDLI